MPPNIQGPVLESSLSAVNVVRVKEIASKMNRHPLQIKNNFYTIRRSFQTKCSSQLPRHIANEIKSKQLHFTRNCNSEINFGYRIL
jgi:hypothetical protein